MKKQYKIQLPKGKKVTFKEVHLNDGVLTIDVELTGKDENLGFSSRKEAEQFIREMDHINYVAWKKFIDKSKDIKEQKYEPKDGDFVYVKARYEHIAIFKKEEGDDMYVYADWNMSFTVSKIIMDDSTPLCCIHDLREIRPTTEEEKKLLIDKLAEKGKKWNPKTKSIEDVRWRANDGDHYYYLLFVDTDLIVTETTDIRTYKDYERYNSGNYFKTSEAAEKAAEQVREIFKNSKAE